MVKIVSLVVILLGAYFFYCKALEQKTLTIVDPDSFFKKGYIHQGYDVLVLRKEIFKLLAEKNLLEASAICGACWTFGKPVYLGRDIAKSFQTITERLRDNRHISAKQYASILESAKTSGGTITNGYVLLAYAVNILDAVRTNKLITLKEGQTVIDRAYSNDQ